MRLNWNRLLTIDTIPGRKNKNRPFDGRTSFDNVMPNRNLD